MKKGKARRSARLSQCGLLVCHAVDGEDAVVIEGAELADNAGVEEGAALGKLTQLLLAEHADAELGEGGRHINGAEKLLGRVDGAEGQSRSLSPSLRVRRQTASP